MIDNEIDEPNKFATKFDDLSDKLTDELFDMKEEMTELGLKIMKLKMLLVQKKKLGEGKMSKNRNKGIV